MQNRTYRRSTCNKCEVFWTKEFGPRTCTIENDIHDRIVDFADKEKIELMNKWFVDLDSTQIKANAKAMQHDAEVQHLLHPGP
jgi:hypothetical protein